MPRKMISKSNISKKFGGSNFEDGSRCYQNIRVVQMKYLEMTLDAYKQPINGIKYMKLSKHLEIWRLHSKFPKKFHMNHKV